MRIGMIGLGRMGGNMVRRLLRAGHECVVWNQSPGPIAELAKLGAIGASSLPDLVAKLPAPRTVWIMVPVPAVEGLVQQLAGLLGRGDCVIDGGNSPFEEAIRRSRELAGPGIDFMDVGTSGGVWGLERGYCLMVGGEKEPVQRLDSVFRTLAPGRGEVEPAAGRKAGGSAEDGYLHCGPSGAGHFVKMVHNGIEYGLMQAYAEGFDILKSANSEALAKDMRYDFQLADIAELWRRGSVVGSWLLDLSAQALAQDPRLERYTGYVQDSGEGRWTIQAAIEEAVPADVLTAALYTRFRSRQEHTFAEKCLSAMREQFGGHVEPARK